MTYHQRRCVPPQARAYRPVGPSAPSWQVGYRRRHAPAHLVLQVTNGFKRALKVKAQKNDSDEPIFPTRRPPDDRGPLLAGRPRAAALRIVGPHFPPKRNKVGSPFLAHWFIFHNFPGSPYATALCPLTSLPSHEASAAHLPRRVRTSAGLQYCSSARVRCCPAPEWTDRAAERHPTTCYVHLFGPTISEARKKPPRLSDTS